VFRFPLPSGPYAIGPLPYHWIDRDRLESFTVDPDDHRELMVQIWYPAKGNLLSSRASYVPQADILRPLAHLLRLPEFTLGHLKYVTTNASPSVPVADGEPSYPVLIFLSGRGGYRQSNTFQIENLVSHGYIVAAVDQTYVSAGVVFPDGRLIRMDSRMYDPARPGHAAFLDRMLPFLSEDIIFTLDQLAILNDSDPYGILTGRLDVQHAGIFGVSGGGIVAGQTCLQEPRLRACLVMDAFMPVDVARSGLEQPVMWISRDAQTMQREGWLQADIDETQTTMRTAYENGSGDGYLVLVPGMFHADFSDAPLLSPLTAWLGISGSIDGQRAHKILNVYSLAFFDRYLRGLPTILLDGRAEDFPEVLLETRKPSSVR
jgi:predicted dienelactone hydrolase